MLLPPSQACAGVISRPCVYFSYCMSAVTPSHILNMLTTLEIVTLSSLIRPRIPRITAPPRSDLCPDLPPCPRHSPSQPPAPAVHSSRPRWARHRRVVISCPHTLKTRHCPRFTDQKKKNYRRCHAGELKYSRS